MFKYTNSTQNQQKQDYIGLQTNHNVCNLLTGTDLLLATGYNYPLISKKRKHILKNLYLTSCYNSTLNKYNKVFYGINQIETNKRTMPIKLNLLTVTYANLDFIGRFRQKLVKSLYHIILFENTISLKNVFYFWIKLMPLKLHRKLIISLFENMVFIEFFNYLFFNKFKMLFVIKGKLGLSGDSKKRKNIQSFSPEYRYQRKPDLFYDGKGSASRFGLTFFKVAYAQTNFLNLQNYDYITEA